jgi:hypothetical protein
MLAHKVTAFNPQKTAKNPTKKKTVKEKAPAKVNSQAVLTSLKIRTKAKKNSILYGNRF